MTDIEKRMIRNLRLVRKSTEPIGAVYIPELAPLATLIDEVIAYIEENAELVPQPCPSCRGTNVKTGRAGSSHYVSCENPDCETSGPNAKSRNAAIRKWNDLTTKGDA